MLTCTNHVFVVQKLPEKATEMLNLVETEDTHAAASDNSATSDMVETSELSESEKTDIDSVKVANKNSEDVVASASEETEKVSENLEVLKKEVEDALKDSEPASETAIDTKEEPDVEKDSETGKTTEENFDIEDNEESSIEDELDVLEDELPLL